jgi:DNA-binding NarL/FixJ family response regulator
MAPYERVVFYHPDCLGTVGLLTRARPADYRHTAVTFADQTAMFVIQRATRSALSCLRSPRRDNTMCFTECEDDQDSIVAVVSQSSCCVTLLEPTALTESLMTRLERNCDDSPTIILRGDGLTQPELEEFVVLGCRGFISSQVTILQFRRMLIAVNGGEMWLDRMLSTYLIRQSLARQKYATLSRREREVLDLLQLKLKNREIAEALAISEETLRWHLRHLYAKTKLRSRNELILYAEERNFYEFKPRVEDKRQAASVIDDHTLAVRGFSR